MMKKSLVAVLCALLVACGTPKSKAEASAREATQAASPAASSVAAAPIRYEVKSAGQSLAETEQLCSELERAMRSMSGIGKISSRTEAGLIVFSITSSGSDDGMLSTKIESALRTHAPRASFSRQ